MSAKSNRRRIFQEGSRTYFWSSWFFPPEKLDQVTRLYAFVRVADDYVDASPPRRREFQAFVRRFREALVEGSSVDPVIAGVLPLLKAGVKEEWLFSFLRSMEADLRKKMYRTLAELKEYMYGSAEVIGLAMAVLMGTPESGYRAARLLGRSMQLANFIRDVEEDNQLGRQYLPLEEVKKYGLIGLSRQEAKANSAAFAAFIRFQIARYWRWRRTAGNALRLIPRRYRIPVLTAAQMYDWTMKRIDRQPERVFERKIKPSRIHIIFQGLLNMVVAGW